MKRKSMAIVGGLIVSVLFCTTAQAVPLLWEPNFGADLGLTDDSTTNVNFGFSITNPLGTYSSGTVSSNGFIRIGGSTSNLCCDANVNTFLSGAPFISPGWFDIRPPAVFFNTFDDNNDTFTDRAVVTWSAPEFSSNIVNTFQAQLFASGQILFGYDVLGASSSHRHHGLIGVTPGGGAANPGEIDFSSALPFNSGSGATVYEFFARGPNGATGPNSDPFDVAGSNICFDPNASGGWNVTDGSGGCPVAAVPEPGTLALLGLGLVGMGMRRRKKKA